MKTGPKTNLHPTIGGSILPMALMSTAILAMVAATTLYRVTPRLTMTYHSASWAEALYAAETGADVALKAMNDSIGSPSTAWAGWTPSDATTFPKTWVPAFAAHGGDGNTKIYTRVTVDNDIMDALGTRWMRVRSLGAAELPGPSRTGIEGGVRDVSGKKSFRSILRKERFKVDITNGALHLPQVIRNIEVMAAPPGKREYMRAVVVQNSLTMKGDETIDSYDSTDPTKSTLGQYDPTKRQMNGDVASNSTGGISDLKGANIYGDASSNGGALLNTAGVKGNVYNNFSATLSPIKTPVWTSFNMAPVAISDPLLPVILTGGTASSPQNYKLTDLSVKNATGPLILAPHLVGQESYINIWVTGKLSVAAQGVITQQRGVHVKIYVEDDIATGAGGIVNKNGDAASLEVFGVTPASGSKTVSFSGSAIFIGVINAPDFDFSFGGTADLYGAIIGRSAIFKGNPGLHYDENLANLGGNGSTNYQFASWVEDIR
jgi:hypothetical protein